MLEHLRQAIAQLVDTSDVIVKDLANTSLYEHAQSNLPVSNGYYMLHASC
jgi:hypothetical protein